MAISIKKEGSVFIILAKFIIYYNMALIQN